MRKSNILIAMLAVIGSISPLFAQTVVEPGGRPEDTMLAGTNPDEFAWRLFLYINRQALPGTAGAADPAKRSIRDFDPDRNVVWETWALASGLVTAANADGSLRFVGDKSEVFKKPATEPIDWDKLDRAAPKPFLTSNLQGAIPALNLSVGHRKGGTRILVAPMGVPAGDEEVRMNRSTYETIRSKRLYSIEGLEDAASKAKAAGQRTVVEFEPASKEVKAQWVRLTACDPDKPCSDKERYHWRIISNQTTDAREIWGLASLHIITKDLKNWFWADFGHVDCETGVGPCGDFSADEGNVLRDSTTNGPGGNGPSGSNGIRSETLKSKWENYRLRGTQVAFVTSEGLPTILSNPVIESSFQKSSCLTCHSYATVGLRGSVPEGGTSIPRFIGADYVRNIGSSPPPRPDIGAPVCSKFYNKASGACPDDQSSDQTLYFQTDFLWDMPFRAFSEK